MNEHKTSSNFSVVTIRFDFDENMGTMDFSTCLAYDALYLAYIYKEVENNEKSETRTNK